MTSRQLFRYAFLGLTLVLIGIAICLRPGSPPLPREPDPVTPDAPGIASAPSSTVEPLPELFGRSTTERAEWYRQQIGGDQPESGVLEMIARDPHYGLRVMPIYQFVKAERYDDAVEHVRTTPAFHSEWRIGGGRQ